MNAARHIKNFFAAWATLDATMMASFYADDATMEDPALDASRIGRHAVERYYSDMFADLRRPEHTLLDWATRGRRVWFEWTFSSVSHDAHRTRYQGVSIQTLRGALIVHDCAYWAPDG